ncbi:hypothetical protein TIFTF001_054089 [Ficus carica]|uniref:Reverse transcriptase zinc-binding domain-containing protein n=1 Tax=Ficus carica TaxID=3494 RepID=A0AA88JGK5_FICCA|nr:hypothetical protein TIFTF001_054089 [Ficus carica]
MRFSVFALNCCWGEETLLWIGDNSGKFTVKSPFRIACGFFDSQAVTWKKIWKAKLHERLKFFLRKIASGALPTKERMQWANPEGNGECLICSAVPESASHLSSQCSMAKFIGK